MDLISILLSSKLNKSSGSSSGGTTNYLDLKNKPKINNIELSNNKSLEDLGINIPQNLVNSVAGKTGTVTLNANDITFSSSDTYNQNTIGAELSNQKNMVNQKIEKPINPTINAFLMWNGTAWVAQTLATWQGGNY